MGPFKLLVALALAAAASAQVVSSPTLVLPTTTVSQVFLPPSGTNLPAPSFHSASDTHVNPSKSTTVVVVVQSSSTLVGAPVPFSSSVPVSTSGVTIQTIDVTNSTALSTSTVIVNGSSTVPASSSSSVPADVSQSQSTIVLTTTLSGTVTTTKATGTTTSSAKASQSSGAAVQGKMGGVGVVVAVMLGVIGA
jgi:hypothetical protein